MLGHIKRLEAEGLWIDLCRLAIVLTPGDQLARVYIALSKLQEDAATDGAAYRKALTFAQRATAAGVPGGLMWTWAHGRAAALAADLGLDQTAEQAAIVFLSHLDDNPNAIALAPWVWAALARVRARQGRYAESIDLWHRVLDTAHGELEERARLHLVWTLAESGRIRSAAAALPTSVEHVPTGLLASARAIVAASTGDWSCARSHALAALKEQSAGEWATYDTIQTAELLLILRKAAMAMGDRRQASIWFAKTVAILSRWNAGIMTHLVPTLRGVGGEYIAAADPRGCAGSHRWSLTGTVG